MLQRYFSCHGDRIDRTVRCCCRSGRSFSSRFLEFYVRRADDKALGMASVMIGHVPLAVLALLWMGLPSLAGAPYILMSAVLHAGYSVFLLHAYRFGELSEIYPIARGHRLF